MEILLNKEECQRSIGAFYDLIAEKIGYCTRGLEYDIRYIFCSEKVFQAIKEWYKSEEGYDDLAFSMVWVLCGAKASLKTDDYRVIIKRGFISERSDIHDETIG